MNLFNSLNESLSYEIQKGIINREVNWGSIDYAANQAFFKKTKEEKALLYNLKHQWRDGMKTKFGNEWTKKTSDRKKYLELHEKYTF
jgi:hypothetical protein